MEPKKRKRKRENEMADVGIVFQKMLVLLLMMSVGFAAGKLGVMTQQGNHCLSVLINKVTMPCLLLHASVSGERVLGNGDVLLLTGLYFAASRFSLRWQGSTGWRCIRRGRTAACMSC